MEECWLESNAPWHCQSTMCTWGPESIKGGDQDHTGCASSAITRFLLQSTKPVCAGFVSPKCRSDGLMLQLFPLSVLCAIPCVLELCYETCAQILKIAIYINVDFYTLKQKLVHRHVFNYIYI